MTDPRATSRIAGRELDAEIAVALFGWDVQRRDHANPARSLWRRHEHPCGRYSYSIVPAFSTTWEGLGLVVEAMSRRGFHARITSPFEPGELHFVGFTPHGISGWNGRPDFEEGAETAPHAGSLAALKTIREAAPLAEEPTPLCECGHRHATAEQDGVTSVFHRCRATDCGCREFTGVR